MAITFTPNLHLELQGTGDNVGTWGVDLNANVFTTLDTILGGKQTVPLSNVDVTLTTIQTQNNLFVLTGVLSANVNLIFPAIGRSMVIINNTTGAFTVTLKTTGGGLTVPITQGKTALYTISGNDAFAATDPDTLKRNLTALISVGFTVTPFNAGTLTTGTFTPVPASGNYQYLINGGAFSIAAPAADCAITLMVTNNASAGAITFTGFTVGASTGSPLTTTNGNRFIITIVRINGVSTYTVYALQ